MFENSENAALDFIMSFSHSGKPVKDLSRARRLMQLVGDPQDRLRFIHIAGTNGKGSTAQMFAEIFIDAGYKTGIFTSPYILEYSDRIRVNNKNIGGEALAELTERVKNVLDGVPEKNEFSQFEITQAIAFLYFEKMKCDIVVLETGMGGLLDCTNVVSTSVLSVICSVDFDHTAILGDTLEKIAFQKAGIIKPGIPCVFADFRGQNEVRKVVSKRAAELGSPIFAVTGNDLKVISEAIEGNEFEASYNGEKKLFKTKMPGKHQIQNALTVIKGMEIIGKDFGIKYENVCRGIKKAVVTGRTEVIGRYPLTILDGAHNPDGTRALAELLKISGKSEIHAVIGMCRDKNITEAIKPLLGCVNDFVAVDGFNERAEIRSELAAVINSLGGTARAADRGIKEEIKLLQKKYPDGLTLICGSLFLISEVLD